MSEIVPTILANNIDQYKRFEEVYSNFAKRVQIDICDGQFTPAPTVSEDEITFSEKWSAVDLHMMVTKPSLHLETILKLKPSLCIFHAEASENLLPIFDKLHEAGIKTGVALLKQTYPGNIQPYIEAVDHVLIFAGKLGQQGGEADMLQTEKVSIIRSIKEDVEIGWDGGANMQNIRALAHSDIDVINVGSALSHAQNAASTYQVMVAELDKSGVVL